MFRCCDCGCEYKIKPDFCDCGNDTFEEISSVNVEPEEEEILPVKKHKKTFSEQYPALSGFMETLDPISVIIFIICIVLSVCSFIFIKPNEDTTAQPPKDEQKAERKVADINTFWNDTPPKPEPKIAKQTPTTAENIVNQIINIIPKSDEPKPKTTNTTVQKPKTTAQKPVQTQTVKPKTQTTKPKIQTQKPVQTTKPQTTTQSQQQIKPANTIQPQPQNNSPQITYNPPQINTVSPQQAEQELKSFKRGLQSAYASRIKGNLLQVYGDGNCVIVFKVDSSGRITNRSFSKQSTNNTLNDAVYNSVMSMPSYKTPPSSYKGQTLHLSVSITNGMAQISVY